MHTDHTSAAHPKAKYSTIRVVTLTALIALSATACTMTETGQRTGTGAAIGALGGAVLGTSRESAAIGAAVGAAGGYLYDQYHKREDAQAENAQLKQENQQLKQQQSQ